MDDGDVKFSSLSGFMQGTLVLLSIMVIVVPCTVGFVNLDKRIDITEKKTDSNSIKNEKKFDDMDCDIDINREKIHAMELQVAKTDAHYQDIMRSISEVKSQLDNLERVD